MRWKDGLAAIKPLEPTTSSTKASPEDVNNYLKPLKGRAVPSPKSQQQERDFRTWLAEQRQVSDYIGLALELLLTTTMLSVRAVTYESQLLEYHRTGTCTDPGQGRSADHCCRSGPGGPAAAAACWPAGPAGPASSKPVSSSCLSDTPTRMHEKLLEASPTAAHL